MWKLRDCELHHGHGTATVDYHDGGGNRDVPVRVEDVKVIIDLEAEFRAPESIDAVDAWLGRAGHPHTPASTRLGVGCGCCEEP